MEITEKSCNQSVFNRTADKALGGDTWASSNSRGSVGRDI